jgi:hypothetical protein
LRLRIYYIKNNIVKAYEELDRLDKYMKASETIPPQRIYSYEMFVKNFRRLLRLKEKFSPERLAKTELYLKKSPQFFRKAWIEGKVKELT